MDDQNFYENESFHDNCFVFSFFVDSGSEDSANYQCGYNVYQDYPCDERPPYEALLLSLQKTGAGSVPEGWILKSDMRGFYYSDKSFVVDCGEWIFIKKHLRQVFPGCQAAPARRYQ
jgi:hypothetical protein